jgi:hypothetical protein
VFGLTQAILVLCQSVLRSRFSTVVGLCVDYLVLSMISGPACV